MGISLIFVGYPPPRFRVQPRTTAYSRMTFFASFFWCQQMKPVGSQMGAPATHKSTKNMKLGALGEDPKKMWNLTQNWRPWTFEIYVFIYEELQKSLFPPISKNLTKCFPNCHKNCTKSNKIQVRRPPRKHNKNKRRKQRNLYSKSTRGGGPTNVVFAPQCASGRAGGPAGLQDHPPEPRTLRPPQTMIFVDFCASRLVFPSICGACSW